MYLNREKYFYGFYYYFIHSGNKALPLCDKSDS